MADTNIAYCKIYPGIGIARVGNSPDSIFIGPEAPGNASDSNGSFKDRQGRIKRQAARFRVYGYDDQDNVVQELTALSADITWTVQLANKKASWHKFFGLAAEQQANQSGKELPWRNATITGDDRKTLEITPSPVSISGANRKGDAVYRFDDGMFLGEPVPLGELRTDDAGRLLVLGGFGESDTTQTDNPIHHYANNDFWHDDTSDGPVTAIVQLKDGTPVPVKSTSWVICPPPDFAPYNDNIISLYEAMEDVAIAEGWLPPATDVLFTRDIYPILFRATNYSWVNGEAARGHGPGKPGNLLDPALLMQLASNSDASKPARQNVFARLRNPNLTGNAANAQATAFYMPQLSGDAGDVTKGDATTWLALLPSQYAKMEKWANGDFLADWIGQPPPSPALADIPVKDQPAALNRAVLEHCVGGPFYPGIEMTYICRDPSLYAEAFRLRPDLAPGDITKRMAVPWQADFYQCEDHWWPAQRPDDVLTEAEYDAVVQSFQSEAIEANSDLTRLLCDREPWARGIGQQTIPMPNLSTQPGESDEDYQHRVMTEWDNRINYAGDNDLVDKWSKLGFVVSRQTPNGETIYVETDREAYFGLRDRDYFYIMMNLDAYPDFLPKAKSLAEDFLAASAQLQSDPTLPDEYRYFPYSPRAYNARLDQIYNELVVGAAAYTPLSDDLFKTRDDVVQRIRQLAPFNQTDGGWLRNVTQGGPISEVHSLLFSIWVDEVGNGDPSLNHSNLYTDLLHSVGIYLEDVNTQAYAFDPNMLDSSYTSPLMQLVISQFSQLYFPEILGMTLYLEWEVVELKQTIKLFEYFGLNAQFYKMHVGIDNAVDGHGARVKRAVEIYLDHVAAESGEDAMQEQWKRIWNGYICFKTTGGGDDLRHLIKDPLSLTDQMVAMINRKKPYARLNHDGKQLAGTPINDLFEDPGSLLDALVSSGLLVPGDPDSSPFFNLLRFTGPMYKVFTDEEQKLWADWTRSLTAAQPPPPPQQDAGVAMAALIDTMRDRQSGTPGHDQNQLAGPDPTNPGQAVTHPVAWWFTQKTTDFMHALANDQNGWIVKGNANGSRFVTELLSGDHPMAAALGDVVPGSPHRTWRSVVIDWINADCPIPVAAPASLLSHEAAVRMAAPRERIPRLFLTSSPATFAQHPTGRILGNGTVH